jgi:hypothetical protein
VTSTTAALELGGAGSVLAIWSLLIVIIGSTLFAYSIVVTVRERRRRRRRRQAAVGPPPRPRPPASRQLALPPGPTAGGVPVGRPLTMPRSRSLPPGPASRPAALQSGTHTAQVAHAGQGPPAPVTPRTHGPYPPPPAALPAGPIAGSGYGAGAPPTPDGTIYGSPPGQLPASQVSTPTGEYFRGSDPSAGPVRYGPPVLPGSPPALPAATQALPAATQALPALPPGRVEPAPTWADQPPAEQETAGSERPGRLFKRSRPDECASLRAECEQLREIAAAAADEAAQAAAQAESAHAAYITAQREADEARRHHEEVTREAVEVAAQVTALEPTGGQENPKLQAETSHAAFAAYRRGDITSDQLREVFRRAEGWTPEHDRVSKRATELRAEEAEAVRVRDAALQHEQACAEHARIAALSARALDEKARTAAADARGRCAAADACEQRTRRR